MWAALAPYQKKGFTAQQLIKFDWEKDKKQSEAAHDTQEARADNAAFWAKFDNKN